MKIKCLTPVYLMASANLSTIQDSLAPLLVTAIDTVHRPLCSRSTSVGAALSSSPPKNAWSTEI
eukprot:2467329-Pyramimonas_sp.AAC.1